MPWHFGIPMKGSRPFVTMTYSEAVVAPNPNARSTMTYTEAVVAPNTNARATMTYVETVVIP